MSKRIVAFYLPQYHPIPENDEWWGKGFTEWTNVQKAKPLFRGHHQPKTPGELGYYDLRDASIRDRQAELAKEAGISAFCYWHYWFNGRRLLELPFNEVIRSGKPDFPFCLCWANHSWEAKTWKKDVPNRMLLEQTYPGEADFRAQFNAMLDAFKDPRYYKIDGKLVYGIFDPVGIKGFDTMKTIWNDLARENGLEGFYFFSLAQGTKDYAIARDGGYDAVIFDAMFDATYIHHTTFINKIRARLKTVFRKPFPIKYDFYVRTALDGFKNKPDAVPCLLPNFDHSPRSGVRGVILHDSTPDKWGHFCKEAAKLDTKDDLIFIKSWNEWGEGNYLEPDGRWGKAYIEETAEAFK